MKENNVVQHPFVRLEMQLHEWRKAATLDELIDILSAHAQQDKCLDLIIQNLSEMSIGYTDESLNRFAQYILTYDLVTPSSSPAADEDVVEGAKGENVEKRGEWIAEIRKSLEDAEAQREKQRSKTGIVFFDRALPFASAFQNELGGMDPVAIIESHAAMIFAQSGREFLGWGLELGAALRMALRIICQHLYMSNPEDKRIHVLLYAMSGAYDPDCDKLPIEPGYLTLEKSRRFLQGHFTLQELRSLSDQGEVFSELLFKRWSGSSQARADGPDPWPKTPEELLWIPQFFARHLQVWLRDEGWPANEQDIPKWFVRCLIYCYGAVGGQLCESFESEDLLGDEEVVDVLNHLWKLIDTTSERLGGTSFLPFWSGAELMRGFDSCDLLIQHQRLVFDFPLEFSGLLYYYDMLGFASADEFGFESAFPRPGLFKRLISDCLAWGYPKLAQALAAYNLVETALIRNGYANWRDLREIINQLKNEPYFDVVTACARAAEAVWQQKGQMLLAARLSAIAELAPINQAKLSSPPEFVYLRPDVSREEIRYRLEEAVTAGNWRKLSEDSKAWLEEAEYNFSTWRFHDKNDRKDWSGPAMQYAKALEHELARHLEESLKTGGYISSERPRGLGNYIFFLRKATGNDARARSICSRIGFKVPSRELCERLDAFAKRFRNPAAHPENFDLEKIDHLHQMLFPEHLLRNVFDLLPNPS